MSALAELVAATSDGSDVFVVLTGVARILDYLGFVLVVGVTFFLAWLWPSGAVEWVFLKLFYVGLAVMFLATGLVGVFSASGSFSDAFAGVSGAAALARMSALALGLAFAWEIVGSPRRWRVPVTAWQLVVIATFVADSDALSEPLAIAKVVATTGHLAATAAWLGGLLALAVILIPSEHLDVLHTVLPRFSTVAVVCVITLTLTGVVHAVAVVGSVGELLTSTYGAVLMMKVIVFAVMLLLGNVGRRYAMRLAHRKLEEFDATASGQSVRAFAAAVGAEFALATAVLATTAALVHVSPAA